LWFSCTIEVLHLKHQIEIGIGVAEGFMERRMLMVISDKSSDFASVQRRALADATTHFENACIEKMHHVGFVDLSKFGRLTVPDITDVVNWSHRVLSYNPNYSNLDDDFQNQQH